MVSTAHLLVGAAIVSKVHSLPLAFILAFLSHFLLDFLPHREYPIQYIKERRWKNAFWDSLKVFADAACGILLIFIFSENFPLALSGGIISSSPDGLTLLYFIFPGNTVLKWLSDFHRDKLHYWTKNKKITVFWGIASQAITILTALLVLSS